MQAFIGICNVKSKYETDDIEVDTVQTKDGKLMTRTQYAQYPSLFRAYNGIYDKSRYFMSLQIKKLMDNQKKIYRIATDSILCEKTNIFDDHISQKLGDWKIEDVKAKMENPQNTMFKINNHLQLI